MMKNILNHYRKGSCLHSSIKKAFYKKCFFCQMKKKGNKNNIKYRILNLFDSLLCSDTSDILSLW